MCWHLGGGLLLVVNGGAPVDVLTQRLQMDADMRGGCYELVLPKRLGLGAGGILPWQTPWLLWVEWVLASGVHYLLALAGEQSPHRGDLLLPHSDVGLVRKVPDAGAIVLQQGGDLVDVAVQVGHANRRKHDHGRPEDFEAGEPRVKVRRPLQLDTGEGAVRCHDEAAHEHLASQPVLVWPEYG